LLHGGGTECITGGDNDLFVVFVEYIRELGDARGFTGAVYAGNKDNSRAGLGKV